MIITRTPFRVTLGGGGTDLPSYYREHGGFVFAMGIDKYMYIMLNPPTVDELIRLHYSRSETVAHVSELRHELAREALRHHGIERGMEVSSMADLPDGTGLGSSGAYLVGLLLALHQYRRDYVPLQVLAEEACTIELDVLGRTVGKQDQYMATYGGLTVLEIGRDGGVRVRSVDLPSGSLAALVANTHLYYTGVRRSATEVLRDQHLALSNGGRAGSATTEALHEISVLGRRILAAIEAEDFDGWGLLLHEHWQAKRRLSEKISLTVVDELYEHVRREYGVLGGKIAGAGGGGFLLLYCAGDHRRLEAFMADQGMPRLHYDVAHEGAKVVADLTTTPALRRGLRLRSAQGVGLPGAYVRTGG
jgi:D-glycero-alpha-D-manno-heptose-7-phosphate kinase